MGFLEASEGDVEGVVDGEVVFFEVAVVVLRGGVGLFGSDEEIGEIIVFYYMWALHDISYVAKI